MKPLRVALTGGIATGKSYCVARLQAAGAPVIDADRVAHEAVAPGTPGAAAVLRRFGTLDRAEIAAVVFRDVAARHDLEAIIHPRVYDAIETWFAGLKGRAPFGIADIPLLFETGRERQFHRVIVTRCTPAQQRERLLARGMSAADADGRLAAQLPFETKVARAHAAGVPVDVIDTSGTMASTDRQVDALLDRLSATNRAGCP
jgi:dephospho-CoA kinase